jgi:hypothetical protein
MTASTTNQPQAQSQPQQVRDIPVWLTAIILLLCIGGGGWLIRWYLQKDKPGQTVTLADDKLPANVKAWKNAQGGGPGNQGRPQRINAFQATPQKTGDGIHELNKKSWRVISGKTVMQVNLGRKDELDISPYYAPQLRTAEEAELATIRMSILNDATWRETLNITPEQMAKLKKVPVSLGMKIDEADKAKLANLFKAWQKANDKATEKAVVAGLDEVGKKCEGPTKEYEAQRAQAVRDALTPEQLKLYREGGTAKPAGAKPQASATK